MAGCLGEVNEHLIVRKADPVAALKLSIQAAEQPAVDVDDRAPRRLLFRVKPVDRH
jgi:hypothetical protein